MIEKKTLQELVDIYSEICGNISRDIKETDKVWISKDSLLPKLEELMKMLKVHNIDIENSGITVDKALYLLKTIIKEIKEMENKEWISRDSLVEELRAEIDETLKESGNNPFDEGYMECCSKLINKLNEKENKEQ